MIPKWTMAGVLPPIKPGLQGNAADRSPYIVTMSALIERFSTSLERNNILLGLLNFRQEIYNAGLNIEFQWIDGSFTEDVETLESRAPRDIDAVSFISIPQGVNQQALLSSYGQLFDHDYVKNHYHVDSYFEVLGNSLEARQVRKIAYWYSMWSHRRNEQWKGYLQIPFNPIEDSNARLLLGSIMAGALV